MIHTVCAHQNSISSLHLTSSEVIALGSNYYNTLPELPSCCVTTCLSRRAGTQEMYSGVMMCVFTCSHYLRLKLRAALQNDGTVNMPVLKTEFTDHRKKASGCFVSTSVLKQHDALLGHYWPPDWSRSTY